METLRKLAITSPSTVQRAWALSHLAGFNIFYGRNREGKNLLDEAVALDPSGVSEVAELTLTDEGLGHAEDSLAACNRFFDLVNAGSTGDLSPESFGGLLTSMKVSCARQRGAYAEAASAEEDLQEYHFYGSNLTAPMFAAALFALDHDGASATAALATRPQYSDRNLGAYASPLAHLFLLKELQNWTAAAADLGAVDRAELNNGRYTEERHTIIWPWLAYSWARLGNFKGAKELVALTPLDCNLCLRMRGAVHVLSGDPTGASRLFAQAVSDAPSSPFPYFDWGTMLLHHGDYDGAIAMFEQAHEKGPHFADPLETWGEALMQENRSDLALAKFEEANRYAPHWGRLHFKWGEALLWLGRKDEARAQFGIAGSLDLSQVDRSQLDLVRHRVQ